MADGFTVSRSTVINVPAHTIFSFVNDFHQWALWSPWEKVDVELTRSYSGPDAGVGAGYAWSGKKTGAGTMEIIASKPEDIIAIDLRFSKPFKAHNPTNFKFTEGDGGTSLVWTMTGQYNWMSKLMSLFMDMDKMVGKDFETGLANLKTISEATQTTL